MPGGMVASYLTIAFLVIVLIGMLFNKETSGCNFLKRIWLNKIINQGIIPGKIDALYTYTKILSAPFMSIQNAWWYGGKLLNNCILSYCSNWNVI
jgi:hypothetical protein